MGIIDATADAFGGVFGDQWKDVVTSGDFDERTVVAPGIRKRSQQGRGSNQGLEDVLSNGSLIYVPEGTAAFVFSRAGIEQMIEQPGGYEYRDGEASVFDAQDRHDRGVVHTLLGNAVERIGFGGMAAQEKRIAFVNLREVRGLRFGTRGPLVYNDAFYGTDLELFAYGTFSVRVVNPTLLLQAFVPAGVTSYSLDEPAARKQLTAELLHAFMGAVGALSGDVRVSQLPSHATELAGAMRASAGDVGSWGERFGLALAGLALENVELSDDSRELVRRFAERRMDVAAYEGVSKHAADVAAQQKIAEGVRDNGLGDAGGMLFGMNLAGMLSPRDASAAPAPAGVAANAPTAGEAPVASASPKATPATASVTASLDEQLAAVAKLKELADAGVLTPEEFAAKKREVLGL